MHKWVWTSYSASPAFSVKTYCMVTLVGNYLTGQRKLLWRRQVRSFLCMRCRLWPKDKIMSNIYLHIYTFKASPQSQKTTGKDLSWCKSRTVSQIAQTYFYLIHMLLFSSHWGFLKDSGTHEIISFLPGWLLCSPFLTKQVHLKLHKLSWTFMSITLKCLG